MRKALRLVVLLLFVSSITWAQTQAVTGKVTSSDDGMPLPGVNVVVQGTNRGTTTDAEGNYTLQIGADDKSLVFTFVGFRTFTTPINGRTTIDIAMESDITSLDEVVVIGYGEARKSDLTGAVAQVKGEDLVRVPSATAGEALQGRVAGVQVTTNGAPGSAPTIRVRGLGSVSSRTEPLYVVDGVLTDDITFLGSTDIESINVLKDASASAIYGIRASGGVVIITTKRGNKEQPRITYNGFAGFQKAINKVEMASGPEYIQLLNEKDAIAASRNNGTITPRDPANFPASTNWYSQILRETPLIQSHDITVAGGTEATQFSLGGSYFSQKGLASKTDYERINIRSSVESQVAKFLKIGINANLSNSNQNNAPANLFNAAYIAPPAIPVKLSDGSYASPQAFGDFPNPAASQEYYHDLTKGIRLVGGVFADVNLFKGLTFRTYYGADGNFNQNRKYIPYYFVSTTQRDTTRTLTRKIENYFTYYWDNTLTYKFNINEQHNFTVLAGMNASEQRFTMLEGRRQGVQDFGENTWYLNRGSQTGQFSDDAGNRYASLSYFGRLLYNFNERYLLTATLRRDESSLFPKDNRAAYFPSVGLGWVLSSEQFMADQNIFQFLKLRGSWGRMGNANIPPAQFIQETTTGGKYGVLFPGGSEAQQGASITTFRVSNLFWEFTEEVDVALEGEVLESKLSFELDFYRRITKDAIFSVTTNGALGATNTDYLANNADIVNKGIEASLTWRDQIADFKYSVSGVYAYNHNEVSSLAPGTLGIYAGNINVTPTTYTIAGHSIGEFYGRQVVGIFQNQTEIDSYVNGEGTKIQPNAKPGDFKFLDANNDGTINDKDRVFLGSAIPKYNFGITLTGGVKGFDLALDLYAQGGNKIYNARRYRQLGNENYDKNFYDNRWHGEGTSYDYPSADLSNNENKQANSWYLESGNFFKIRNVQVGYTIPSSVTSRIGVSKIRVYANAANPLVVFKYNGFSPEIPTPSARFNNLSDVDLNTTSQGVDTNVYPIAATYNFGVNISL
ncbi:SusC/RagA family TonB-linked outer membrane protein [Chryseosolibacter indicus]|uniref:TonB-dependent receptor n=1 Tax=Chryseosolibacter indicus TaxID=2782351 RepID=A0ABS5VQV3_9BACT|nr:TonB-dependent receptor [Chryseosolibacter indicus]MBT1703159.1 TonB-dependent receptor [Chryseosolibacter indicus]